MDGGTTEASDEDLVRRVREGEARAARELFDRHVGDLRARVRRRLPRAVRSKVSESDVVQEAFLAAYLGLGEFEERGDGSFAAWLGKILERKILDETRNWIGTVKRDVRREVDVRSAIVQLAGSAHERGVSADLRDAETRERIARAIETLPAGQRAVMRLVHGERLPVEQAAERLGRSLAATRKLHARAVLRLSSELADPDSEG